MTRANQIQWPCYPSRLRDVQSQSRYSHTKCIFLEKITGPIYKCRKSEFDNYSADKLKDFMEKIQDCPAKEKIAREEEVITMNKRNFNWTKFGIIATIAIAIILFILERCLK